MALSFYYNGEHDIQRQMNRLLNDFFGGSSSGHCGAISRGGPAPNSSWTPRVDVSEDDKKILVHAELPGITKENVNIDITNDVLSVMGERKETKEQNESSRQIRECRYGRFQRQIRLPPHCQVDNVTAKYENGVLEIVVPKSTAPGTKRIEIK